MDTIKKSKDGPWFVELSLVFSCCFWSSVSSFDVWRFAVLENCFRTKYGTNSPRMDEMCLE